MTRGRANVVLALAALAVGAAANAARGQSFTLMGTAPGTNESRVTGLSADGRVACGISATNPVRVDPFRWTAEGGRYDFGQELGVPRIATAWAISGDGATIVGDSTAGFGEPHRAFRWTGPGTYQTIAPAGGYVSSEARGVSHDGSAIAGSVYTDFQGGGRASQAFRWTPGGGVQLLGFTRPESGYSVTQGMSRDGSTVVGVCETGNTHDAFKWTASGGMQVLPPLPGTLPNSNFATATNHNGDIVVGMSGDSAALWRNGTALQLDRDTDPFNSVALAVSDDGSIVTAQLQFAGGVLQAGVWTSGTGMVRLQDFLAMHGVTIPAGLSLSQCYAVSGDGMTFAGTASDSQFNRQGFIATIPSPGASMLVAIGLFARPRRRERASSR